MDSADEATIAIEQLNGFVINGRDLRVHEAAIDRHRSPVAAAAPRSR
jgi:RNA recognition motif-containing protein